MYHMQCRRVGCVSRSALLAPCMERGAYLDGEVVDDCVDQRIVLPSLVVQTYQAALLLEVIEMRMSTGSDRRALAAWDRAVSAYHYCWRARRNHGFTSTAARLAEQRMDETALEVSRLSAWGLRSPSTVAMGGDW